MSGSVETQKHMFLIRPSHCLHVVTMSLSAHPNRPTQVSQWLRGACERLQGLSKSYGCDRSALAWLATSRYLLQSLCRSSAVHVCKLFSQSSHVLQPFFFFGARGVTSVISSCTSLQAPVLRSLLAETDYFQLSRTYLSDINLEERFDCWIRHVSSVYSYTVKKKKKKTPGERCHISERNSSTAETLRNRFGVNHWWRSVAVTFSQMVRGESAHS